MSPRFLDATRLLLVPAFAGAGFITYGYSLEFFATSIPIPRESSLIYGALLMQGFAAAAFVSVLFCYPLAFIYRKSGKNIALIMALPVLFTRLPELMMVNRHPISLAISAYEILAYTVLLIVGAWLAHSHLIRTNITIKGNGGL